MLVVLATCGMWRHTGHASGQLLQYEDAKQLASSTSGASDHMDDEGHASSRDAKAEAAASCSLALLAAAAACEGFSGRILRKMPFLAHATSDALPVPCGPLQFLSALRAAALKESMDRQELAAG